MPDWLQSVIAGDPYAAVGTTLSAGERDRLQNILSRNKKQEMVPMKYQDIVTEALKKKPMLFSEILGQTGIASPSLYNVLAHMKREKLVKTERADGESLKVKYALISADAQPASPVYQALAKTESAPKRAKQLPAVPEQIGMFKRGDKLLITRDLRHLSVLISDQGAINITTGETMIVTPEEAAAARPIVNLKADVMQSVNL